MLRTEHGEEAMPQVARLRERRGTDAAEAELRGKLEALLESRASFRRDLRELHEHARREGARGERMMAELGLKPTGA